MNTINIIKEQIKNNNIILYMKGTPDEPMCGYSAQVVQILKTLNINYKFIDILKYPNIRKELPIYSNWPTFPQLYVKEKLIGGCDIILELYEKNKLTTILK
ncbi:MAG: Grx4 family monothiol glutaredoxin [Candidatus Azosocius agrarius]|nr:MAG: Grx4 family monothiol glutaredoxin [Gammaproteobacteria bacterium]